MQRLLLVALCAAGAAAESCTSYNATDVCRTTFNRKCDAGTTCPEDSDCWDCSSEVKDLLSCGECVAAGGVWCPADVMCFEAPINASTFFADSYLTGHCEEGDWVSECPTNNYPFADKLFEGQNWVYEMVNVKPAWAMGYKGEGVLAHFNDDGVEPSHPDFRGKYEIAASCPDHAPVESTNSHGTTCAAIALAAADGECSVGIAPEANVSSCAFLKNPDFDEEFPYSFLSFNYDMIDISSNSWGVDPCPYKDFSTSREASELEVECPFKAADQKPCEVCNFANLDRTNVTCQQAVYIHCRRNFEDDYEACSEHFDMFVEPCQYHVVPTTARYSLARGVSLGRDGKGVVYVWASGNSHGTGNVVNMEGWQNSRLTISVGAVGKDTKHTRYSTTGAALFISAPGGDFEAYHNHMTAHPSGTCHSAGVGTSYAAPVVTGVVALMLQANPNLTWRDVQGVLQQSASTTIGALGSDTEWTTNSAGVKHHDKYGFGMVDAHAAVLAARDWTNWSEELFLSGEVSETNKLIADNGTAVTSTVTIEENHITESVVVYANLVHPSRGDLEVTLTSPSGTVSVLHPGKRQESQMVETWKLMSLKHWGEASQGEWTLTVRDLQRGDVVDCVDKTNFQGTAGSTTLGCLNFMYGGFCAEGGPGPAWDPARLGPFNETLAFFVDEDGDTPLTACCACGGGMSPDTLTDELTSWRLAVYAHNATETSVPPTGMPTTEVPLTSRAVADENDDMSGGEIAGTVLGAIVLVAVVVGVAVAATSSGGAGAATATEPVNE